MHVHPGFKNVPLKEDTEGADLARFYGGRVHVIRSKYFKLKTIRLKLSTNNRRAR